MHSLHHAQRRGYHTTRSLTAPLILLLAALLRFYNLSGQSLWADEGNSVALARREFVEIAWRTAFDIHPPLYYWLLKLWISVFGDSEIGLRSLSVGLGVGLVYVIGILGTRWFSPRVGLMAALIATFSPLQVYYSQEARMYMLLTLLSSLTVLVASLIWGNDRRTKGADRRYAKAITPASLIYILIVTAGLYTHYAYPLILLAVNLAALLWVWQSQRKAGRLDGWRTEKIAGTNPSPPHSPFTIHNWLILQLIPLLLYLPWLPTAWRQITTWPSDSQSASILTILETVSTTLLFGLSWPFNSGLILIVILLLAILLTFNACPRQGVQHSKFNVLILWLWFLFPVALTVIVFSPAFLKFLLVATPSLTLILALTIEGATYSVLHIAYYPIRNMQYVLKYLVGGALLVVLLSASALSLYYYYTNPTYARDNYRGIARFIQAVAGPGDAVILDAEGQQDVFNYYYQSSAAAEAPVYPLPRRRPLDEAATLAELQKIADEAGKIYAVYWATQQADPNGFIENWLNRHLFKATDQWYGNVRLVSYANPHAGAELPLTPVDYQLGTHIRLRGYALAPPKITPGDILQVALSWETDASLPPDENYIVFVQVLDQANHVVGQRDAGPLTPSPAWPVNQPVADAHGVFIEPGSPPGTYRLIVGLYNSQTGQRLPVTAGQDFVDLSQVEIIRPDRPLPPEAFKLRVVLNTPMLGVTLWGYDWYKLGHRSTPDTPLHSGDPVELVVYWLAHESTRQVQDQLFIQVVTSSGEATPIFTTRQPAGMDYPIQNWQEGEIVRAQYDFFLDQLPAGTYRLALTLSGHEASSQRVTALTRLFRVE